MIGSIANLIVIEQAARQGIRISFREHARAGIPVTLLSMAILYGRDDAAAPERAIAVLRELDLLPLSYAPVGTLSRGQIHKTALAGLMLADPELWLLDEPFSSGMDPLALSYFQSAARAASRPVKAPAK